VLKAKRGRKREGIVCRWLRLYQIGNCCVALGIQETQYRSCCRLKRLRIAATPGTILDRCLDLTNSFAVRDFVDLKNRTSPAFDLMVWMVPDLVGPRLSGVYALARQAIMGRQRRLSNETDRFLNFFSFVTKPKTLCAGAVLSGQDNNFDRRLRHRYGI